MSRAVRFAPLALLLAIIAALVWRLATPADTDVHSALEGKPVPAFSSAALPFRQAGACRRAISRPVSRISSTSSQAGACRASPR